MEAIRSTAIASLELKSSPSGQVRFYVDATTGILHCFFCDIGTGGVQEFLDAVADMGSAMGARKMGKMCMDISSMRNFDVMTRIAVVRNLRKIFLDKIPFLVLSVVKSSSVFENTTMQLAIAASMKLSPKFLASRMWNTHQEANAWLLAQSGPEH